MKGPVHMDAAAARGEAVPAGRGPEHPSAAVLARVVAEEKPSWGDRIEQVLQLVEGACPADRSFEQLDTAGQLDVLDSLAEDPERAAARRQASPRAPQVTGTYLEAIRSVGRHVDVRRERGANAGNRLPREVRVGVVEERPLIGERAQVAEVDASDTRAAAVVRW